MFLPLIPCRLVVRLLLAAVFVSTPALALRAQQNWRYVNPLPGSTYKSVAFGNGLYVAVGDNSMIASSPDATTWTIRRQANSNAILNKVAFADGRFIAVGQGTSTTVLGGALILTSLDGITWTQATVNLNAQLFSIVHNGTIWLASGLSSPPAYATSTDGVTWTVRGVTTGDGLTRVAYGNGRFVGINDQNRVNTSTDGVTWTRSFVVGSADSTSFSFGEVVFFNGSFYTAGRDSGFNGTIYKSTDGATWTQAAAPASSNGGFTFIGQTTGAMVVGGNGGLFTSTDGTTWTKRSPALPPARIGTESVGAVAGANGTLFSLGIYGSITTSPATDGATWTRRTTGTAHDLYGVVYDGSRFVAVGTGGTVVTSPEGTTWTSVTSGSTGSSGKLAFGNGRYATAGLSGLYHSANLTSWSTVAGATNQMFGVIYANNRFVAANNALSLGLYVSTDGSAWTRVTPTSLPSQNVQGLAGGGGNFVVTTGGFGGTPKIWSSADGSTWTDRTPATFTVAPESLAYGNGRFVLLTSSTIWTSPDGIAWTSTAYSPGTMSRVMFVGSKFITRGSPFATYKSSSDGLTWTDTDNSMAPNAVVEAITVKDDFLIGVSYGGTILRADLAAAPAASASGRLINLSVLSDIATAGDSFTLGYVVGGAGTSGTKPLVLRAAGPSLGAFGVAGTLDDPKMETFAGSTSTGSNDNWGGSSTIANAMAAVGAFAYASPTSKDAAIAANITTRDNSVVVSAAGNGTGKVIAEVYDATPAEGFTATTPRLLNVSVRKSLGTGLTAGFVLGGASPTKVLIRVVGPGLAAFGVSGTVADPQLALYNDKSVKIAENNDWAGAAELSAAFTAVGAFGLPNAASKDAALVMSLPPGAYSVQASGVGGASGVAIVEVYEVP
jgi:hypothetical protein